MRKILAILILLFSEVAFASPSFEGLEWMAKVGVGAAGFNLICGLVVMFAFAQHLRKSSLKILLFGIAQFILTIISIPVSWIGTAWIVYWLKGLESFANILFVIGLFVIPAISMAFMLRKYRRSILNL